jgi:hypothetical protein
MLLASFTLHKVQKYLSGFGLRRKEYITWLSLEACNPPELGWRDTDSWRTTILKSFRPFTLPTGIQLAPDFIMQLIWCGCKSGIPFSTKDCGYKRYDFGLLDLYTNILCMFWLVRKFIVIVFRLQSIINGEIWHLKPFHTEFLKFQLLFLNSTYSENVRFDSNIVTLGW